MKGAYPPRACARDVRSAITQKNACLFWRSLVIDRSKTCPECGTEFYSNNFKKKFCCQECFRVARKRYQKNWLAAHPGYMKDYAEKARVHND